MMKVASRRVPENPFERLAFATIQGFTRLPGIVTNNIVLPHTNFRNLPNEHDILVLLTGRVVTLDMKELWPGAYRDASGGWEHEREDGWHRVEEYCHPHDIAFKKAKVLEAFLAGQLPDSASKPQVLSCIVVPDGCDVTQLGHVRNGRTSLEARLLMARLGDLESVLLQDLADTKQRKPTADQLAELLNVEHFVTNNPYMCHLSEDLVVDELLESRMRPVPRKDYLGHQPSLRSRRLRIQVCPVCTEDRSAQSLLQSQRSHLVAIQSLAHPAALRLYDHRLAPGAAIFVYEFFSRTTLEDVIADACMGWDQAARVFRQVTGVLAAAHASNIVHRYLDPSCILLGGEHLDQVRVRDFFGAATTETSTFGQDASATPFDPPERAPGVPADAMMDAFSAGRCLRFALTGDPHRALPPEVPADLQGILAALEAPPSVRHVAWVQLLKLLKSDP